MTTEKLCSMVDHTLLAQTATWEDIQKLCDDAMAYRTASVCIPPCYVKQAAEYVGGKLAICTVIGFPNGYSTTAAKCFEARDAVENGAEEIDMVMESDGMLHPIEIKRTANPGTELVKPFKLLDKASVPRGKGAIICMRETLSAVDSENYIVPIWMI